MKIFQVFIALAFFIIFVIRYLSACFILQLNHYEIKRYGKWLYQHKFSKRVYAPVVTSLIAFILIFILPMEYLVYCEGILALVTIPFIHVKPEKNKLHYTMRMRRLLFFSFLFVVVVFGLTYFICANGYQIFEIIFYFAIINNFLIYDILILACLYALPIENYLYQYYIRKARTKILSHNFLQVVGITGSYGKTSTKFIVGEILKREYSVCITPNSYNTPMGVTLTINQQLKNTDEYFICEMGACRAGEIRELSNIVFPKIGIISAIGPQHLETFGNIKNIIKTKFELIESLPQDGLAILNYDNYYIRNYAVKNKVKLITYGIEQANVDYYALNIHYDHNGSTFEVQFPNKERYLFKTRLLGKHNISNILAGVALADYLKMNVRKIIHTVSTLEPIPHRLELKRLPGYCLIDDSFNANVEGFNNALEILSHFSGKRIIITPGIVELGREQYDINYRLGEKIARNCDYVVLVGRKQTKPLYNALSDLHYPETNIYITSTFDDGYRHVVHKFQKDFTLLIENDLPDQYQES